MKRYFCLIIYIVVLTFGVQAQDSIDWERHYHAKQKERVEQNRGYFDKVLALDRNILNGEPVSLNEAAQAIPASADEVLVLWGNNDEEGEQRGSRIDSVCFGYAIENPRLDIIGKYLMAAYYSDGYVAEIYHTDCYLLWKKHPKEVAFALSTLFGQEENFTSEFQEMKKWEEKQHQAIQR